MSGWLQKEENSTFATIAYTCQIGGREYGGDHAPTEKNSLREGDKSAKISKLHERSPHVLLSSSCVCVLFVLVVVKMVLSIVFSYAHIDTGTEREDAARGSISELWGKRCGKNQLEGKKPVSEK